MRNEQKMMTEKQSLTEINIKVRMHKNEKKGETIREIEREKNSSKKQEKEERKYIKGIGLQRKQRLMKREQERVEEMKSIERVRKERKEKCHFIVLYLLVLNISVDLWVAITYN